MGPLEVGPGEGGVGGADGKVGVGCCVGVGVGCWVGGGVVGGLATQSFKVTESMRQPLPATLTSLPSRQRNWTLCPLADAGSVTVTVSKLLLDPTVPDHAKRPAIGLPVSRVVV